MEAGSAKKQDLFPGLSPVYDRSGYKVYNIYKNASLQQKEAVIKLWEESKALPSGADASQRAAEVVMVITHNNEVAGVSTVSLQKLSSIGINERGEEFFYFYRMFIRQQDRTPMLMAEVSKLTREFLEEYKTSESPAGIVHLLTNKKLERPGITKLFQERGYDITHKTRNGTPAYIKYFSKR